MLFVHNLLNDYFYSINFFPGPASNEVLNANSGLLLDEVKPVLETSLAELFTDVANKITKSFTYKELFPDD